jgi:hypothetical protein
MATTRTIAPMIQPQGVELDDEVRVGALVVVVVGSSVVVVDCPVVVVVGASVVVVVACSVVVVVGSSVVVVDPSGDVVGGSVVGGSEVVVCAGASAEGVCDARPVVVLTAGLWERFDPPPVPQAAITVAAPRIRRQRVPQRTARPREVRRTMRFCLIGATEERRFREAPLDMLTTLCTTCLGGVTFDSWSGSPRASPLKRHHVHRHATERRPINARATDR